MGFVDSVFDGTLGLVKMLVVLIVLTALGGILGGVADVFMPGIVGGTPLGAGSRLSPVLWTAIAGLLVYAGMEVLD